jgi:hypothetical protein
MTTNETQNDEPAFPYAYEERGPNPETNKQIFSTPGMTLRDWFSGQALKGLLANPNIDADYALTAQYAGLQADAMMEERKKRS